MGKDLYMYVWEWQHVRGVGVGDVGSGVKNVSETISKPCTSHKLEQQSNVEMVFENTIFFLVSPDGVTFYEQTSSNH